MDQSTHPEAVGVSLVGRLAQKLVVEAVDVLVVHDEIVSTVGRGTEGGIAVDIATEAPRVRAGAVGARVLADLIARRRHGAKADDHAARSVSPLQQFPRKATSTTHSENGPDVTQPPPPPDLIDPRPLYPGSGTPLPPMLEALPLKSGELMGS